MLTPSGRVVVTDFGLARSSEGDPFQTNVGSGPQGMIGSPAYMAPEQVEGGTVTKAADIYALGVVMFEMVTGQVPFTGDTAISCAIKRLKGPAPSARTHVPDLDPVCERVIACCLEREPGDRFASAGDVVRALAGDVAPPRKGPVVPPRRRRWLPAAAAIGALAVAAAVSLVATRRPASSASGARGDRAAPVDRGHWVRQPHAQGRRRLALDGARGGC